jgi:hypothetical protein
VAIACGSRQGGFQVASKITGAGRRRTILLIGLVVIVVIVLAGGLGLALMRPQPRPPLALRVPEPFLIAPRARLLTLPTTGPAWAEMKSVADGDLGEPDLSDQDNDHAVRTLAVGLVYSRTGDTVYRDRGRGEILAAMGTEREGADNSILALSRQLGAYVLAADLIGLSGPDNERFRSWLSGVRTRDLGGHGRWRQLIATHADSANNWGAFAGASRMAADLYLGDMEDLQRAALVMQGFLGDRAAWSAFQPMEDSADWACNPEAYAPINPPCTLSGIDVDGAIVRDISRGGHLGWPPGRDGVLYTAESLQGLVVQAELLRAAGVDAWSWSDRALLRAAGVLSRADGWNATEVGYHLPWIFNARYGLDLETKPAGFGRLFGYTDWLYGN